MNTCRKGLTLIEILLAVTLLGFGLFGVLDMYLQTARQVDGVRLRARLVGVTEGHLAELRNVGYRNLQARFTNSRDRKDGGESRLFSEPRDSALDPDFLWNAQLEAVQATGRPAIRITVQARLAAPGEGSTSESPGDHGRAQRLSKEATAYVFAR